MKVIVSAVALALVLTHQAEAQATSTTTCVPQPRALPRGTVKCTTITGEESGQGSSIIAGIVKARLGYLEGRSNAPTAPGWTMAQFLEFVAISKPLRIAIADSLALVGSRRDEYFKESGNLMLELFKIYPGAGLPVIHLLLDPLTAKYSDRPK